MDPNAALANMRDLVESLLLTTESGTDEVVDPSEIAEQFQALDEWLTKGGFLPSEWQPKSTSYPCPACQQPVVWDTEHLPTAWRHVENESRWCTLTDERAEMGLPPQMPFGTGDPDRYRCMECGANDKPPGSDCQSAHCVANRGEI